MYFGYMGLLLMTYIGIERNFNWKRLADTAGRVTVMLAAILLLGTLCWPWAQASPFVRPFIALMGVANYPWGGGVLYRGETFGADELPWDYVPWWLLISTPPVVLIGLAFTGVPRRPRGTALAIAALWFTALFPLGMAFAMHSTLYDGIRHLSFIYPILAVLAAAGWASALASHRASWFRRVAAIGLAAGLASILYVNIRLHPNQTAYFNTLVGGPRGAFARYDMDYWGNCVLAGVKWTVEQARATGVPVTVSGNPEHLVELNAERFKEVAFTSPNRERHYFTIRLLKGPVDGLQELAAAPALHRVTTPDGALLCAVQAGPAYPEFEQLQSRARR